ncbi:Fic family protein [Corynebacterium afermentans]|uniref:Fic family protein n=1 Tax=Corynebacterium afermentans TaxID=38286 RepID=UPI0025738776|nr:Fic family protein [Corynebacterium afermentans]MCG7272934.1 Fic family protein [Corynebacterium afermentans]
MHATDWLDVIYTAGVVFDGLSTSRPATDRYLRSGDTDGVRGRGDLALLQDLEAAAEFVIATAGEPVTAAYLGRINAQLTRSAALNPGKLRRAEHGIGVRTAHGPHEPAAVTAEELDALMQQQLMIDDALRSAAHFFVEVARAQPFEDGNKRTAIFAANSYLLGQGAGVLMAVPHDDADPSVSREFHDLLARAYVFGETGPVVEALVRHNSRQ